MRHTIISKADAHPYEILNIKLIAETPEDRKIIEEGDEDLNNYLTLKLNAVELIESTPPIFVIRRAKEKIGFGE